nr:reverse transcriptase domain-containing protein [Tanacetum cinerariifolium]
TYNRDSALSSPFGLATVLLGRDPDPEVEAVQSANECCDYRHDGYAQVIPHLQLRLKTLRKFVLLAEVLIRITSVLPSMATLSQNSGIIFKDTLQQSQLITIRVIPFIVLRAWDRYKDLLCACPHHGFTELHQLDTFYNAFNPADQDSLNVAAGGNLLERRTQDVLTIIENKSKVRNSRKKSVVSQVKLCDANSNSSSKVAKLTHAVNQQTSVVTTTMTAILKQFQSNPTSSFHKSC